MGTRGIRNPESRNHQDPHVLQTFWKQRFPWFSKAMFILTKSQTNHTQTTGGNQPQVQKHGSKGGIHVNFQVLAAHFGCHWFAVVTKISKTCSYYCMQQVTISAKYAAKSSWPPNQGCWIANSSKWHHFISVTPWVLINQGLSHPLKWIRWNPQKKCRRWFF